MFRLSFLDHVALRCADVNASARWYQEVLGLQRLQLDDWPAIPVMMLTGQSGVALFPLKKEENGNSALSSCTDHFAFRVERDDLRRAREHFDILGIAHETQHHPYFESVYLHDPDGHRVELTALASPEPRLMSFRHGAHAPVQQTPPLDSFNS